MAGVDAVIAVKTKSDLPTRALSAVVMLAIAGAAFWFGGVVLDLFIAAVATLALLEMLRLVDKAAGSRAGRITGALGSVVYVGLATASLMALPRFLVLIVVGIVVFTDTGAYFAGRMFGKRKIAPSISPSKTWAGLYGGMILAGLFAAGAFGFLQLAATGLAAKQPPMPYIAMIAGGAIGAVLAIFAQAGDFFESWLKRKAGVKDSSNIIPGHGGVFDRVDGLLSVAIVAGLASLLFVKVH